MWRQKLSKEEKIQRRRRAEKRRRQLKPTRQELQTKDGARIFCQERKLSKAATRRISDLVTGKINDLDWRDQRTLCVSDRVPRSLEEWCPPTPPHFWDIQEPGDPQVLESTVQSL